MTRGKANTLKRASSSPSIRKKKEKKKPREQPRGRIWREPWGGRAGASLIKVYPLTMGTLSIFQHVRPRGRRNLPTQVFTRVNTQIYTYIHTRPRAYVHEGWQTSTRDTSPQTPLRINKFILSHPKCAPILFFLSPPPPIAPTTPHKFLSSRSHASSNSNSRAALQV